MGCWLAVFCWWCIMLKWSLIRWASRLGRLFWHLPSPSLRWHRLSRSWWQGGDNAAYLARDTVFAAIMLILMGVLGLCLMIGGLKHCEYFFIKSLPAPPWLLWCRFWWWWWCCPISPLRPQRVLIRLLKWRLWRWHRLCCMARSSWCKRCVIVIIFFGGRWWHQPPRRTAQHPSGGDWFGHRGATCQIAVACHRSNGGKRGSSQNIGGGHHRWCCAHAWEHGYPERYQQKPLSNQSQPIAWLSFGKYWLDHSCGGDGVSDVRHSFGIGAGQQIDGTAWLVGVYGHARSQRAYQHAVWRGAIGEFNGVYFYDCRAVNACEITQDNIQ